MASSSKSTIQTSPIPTQIQLFSLLKGSSMIDRTDYYCFHKNFQTQTSFNNPSLLIHPFDELGIAPSNRKLMVVDSSICETEWFPGLQNPCCKIRYLEKRPCDFCEFFQQGSSEGEQKITFRAAMADQTSPTHEPLSVHIASGCFCQGARRHIAAFERSLALDDIVIGMEGGPTLLNFHTDQALGRRQCCHVQSFQEPRVDSLFSQAVAKDWSMAPAVRLFLQNSHGVPSINEITATSSRLCGQISSLTSNASLLSDSSEIISCQTSLHGDIHTQLVDHNSARSTGASPSPAHTVLDIIPSSTESARASFSLESNRDVGTRRREEEPLLNRSRLTETVLVISTQAALTLLTIGYGGSSSLSKNAKILMYSSAACNVMGFVCCLLGIIVCGRRRPGLAARITTGMGYIATVYGFVAVMGMLLRDNLKLRITGAACIASFPALAFVFMK